MSSAAAVPTASAAALPVPAADATVLSVPQIYHPDVAPGFLEVEKLAELERWRADFLKTLPEDDEDARRFLNERSTLMRYLVAKRNDTADAIKGIQDTIAWRKTAVSRPIVCEACAKEEKSHCFFPVCLSQPELPEELAHPSHGHGYSHSHGHGHGHSHSHGHGHGEKDDASASSPPSTTTTPVSVAPLVKKPIRRVVVYSCQCRAADSGVEAQIAHVVATAEQLFFGGGLDAALAAAGVNVAAGEEEIDHRFTWLVDFSGFGLSQALQGRVGISTIGTLSKHFPERLHSLVLINAPGVFDLFIGAVRPFVDARTLSKVKTVHAKPGEELIARLMAPDLALTREAAEFVSAANAMKGVPGNLPPLHDSARCMLMPCLKDYYHGPK